MSPAGRYVLSRLFPRATEFAAAHVAITAARVRHEAALPHERRVHLFHFGEDFEGAFERWLVGRKAERTPVGDPPLPGAESDRSVADALAAAGIEPLEHGGGEGALLLGTLSESALADPAARLAAAQRLAGAYAASGPGRLSAPYLRLER